MNSLWEDFLNNLDDREMEFWERVREIDFWLDSKVSERYQNQPLAQDWARISKCGEELGEAIADFISYTVQNPRKAQIDTDEEFGKFLRELADVACTAILAIQHFTKSSTLTRNILQSDMGKIHGRINEGLR